MPLALVIHYLTSQAVRALPLATIAQTSSPTCDIVRTKTNIVWSCLVTIFSCTWVSVHPNIPEPDVGCIMNFLYHARLMMLTLIAPELVIMWAMRQWINARRLGKKYKNWTQTHGFFAIMGGFMEYKGDEPQHVISPDDLELYLKNGEISITEKEIKDKGKGNSLSKALVIVQTSWFILQCIARRVKGLRITELELVTLAFAALNFATYALWWNKPQNVACAVRVYRKHHRGARGGVKESQGQATAETDKPNGTDTGHSENKEQRMHVEDTVIATRKAPVGVERRASRVWNEIKKVPVLGVLQGFIDNYRLLVVVLAAFLSPVWVPFYAFWQVMLLLVRLAGDRGLGDDDIDAAAKQMPTFYSGTTDDDAHLAFFAGVVIAMVFSGIHCVAWSFHFPSHTEQLLWRVSSLTITCVPALEFVIGFHTEKSDIDWARYLSTEIGVLAIVPYILARLTLLVLPLLALRSLTPDTYKIVQWTTFIPHV